MEQLPAIMNWVLGIIYVAVGIPWGVITLWGGVKAIRHGEHADGVNAILAALFIFIAPLIIGFFVNKLLGGGIDISPNLQFSQ